MLLVGIVATGLRRGSLRAWIVAGCLGSAASLYIIALTGLGWVALPLTPLVVALGLFNGMFAVAAIGSMMALAADGRARREGTRMGLWGAAQAVAAGFGGLTGAARGRSAARGSLSDGDAFAGVFLFEAVLFLAAALMAVRVMDAQPRPVAGAVMPGE